MRQKLVFEKAPFNDHPSWMEEADEVEAKEERIDEDPLEGFEIGAERANDEYVWEEEEE